MRSTYADLHVRRRFPSGFLLSGAFDLVYATHLATSLWISGVRSVVLTDAR